LSGALSVLGTGQQAIVYTLLVTNNGTTVTGSTIASMDLPVGTFASSFGLGCGFNGATFVCSVPALAPQQSVSFSATVLTSGVVTVVSATATVDPNSAVVDVNRGNNTSTTSTSLTGGTATPTSGTLPDLIVSLSGTTSSGVGGGVQPLVLFTANVQNGGAVTSGATTLTMPIPAGTYFQSATSPCTFDGLNVSCPVSPLASQQSMSFTIGVAPTGAVGVVSASATVDPSGVVVEANESNNVASTTVYVSSYIPPGGPDYPYYPPLPPQYTNPPIDTNPYTPPAYVPPSGSGAPPFSPPSAPPSLPSPPQIPSAPPSSSTGSQPLSGYPWLQVLSPAQTYSADSAPLWVALPGEMYYVEQTSGDWALAVRDGSSTYWSVWIPLDSSVQVLQLSLPPAATVDELWMLVHQPTDAYGDDGTWLWTAQPDEWYRVITADNQWVQAVWENDSPQNYAWYERSDAVELLVLQGPGPGANS